MSLYFVDSGNALSSWIYKGSSMTGQSIVSGAAYNYASGTLGYEVVYGAGGYPDWRRSFTGTFPKRGICTFAVRPAFTSGTDYTLGPAGSGATAGFGNPFAVRYNRNGSLYLIGDAGGDICIGSSYASGAWIVWKFNFDFYNSRVDLYKDGVLAGSKLDMGTYIPSQNVYSFRTVSNLYTGLKNLDFDDIWILGTSSDNVCNAKVKGSVRENKVCNARVNVSIPGGDQVLVNKVAYTSNWENIRIVKKLSQPSEFECQLVGIEDADKTNVKEENIVHFFSENVNNLMLKGRIKRVQYETEYDCTIKGYGMEIDLGDRKVCARNTEGKSVFTDTNSNTIVSKLASVNDDGASPWLMPISQNDNYGKITIRFDEEDKLKALAAVAEQCGFDWWITHMGDEIDYFNIGLKATTSRMTFYTGGDNQNAWKVNYEKDTENLANFVVALGYGDGINQIHETFYDASVTKTYVSGGIIPGYSSDANTDFLYKFENDANDTGPSGLNLVNSGGVPYITLASGARIGLYSAGSSPTANFFAYTGSPNNQWFMNHPSGTIEGWVWPFTTSRTIVGLQYGMSYPLFYASVSSNKFACTFYNGDIGGKTITSTGTVGSRMWSHVACIWDVEANYAALYLNGVLDSYFNGSYYIPSVAVVNPNMDSQKIYGNGGYLDEVRLSNYPRETFIGSESPSVTNYQTEIGASGTDGFTAPGAINIGNEVIIYSGTTATSFTNCTRGVSGTTAETHPHGALAYKYVPTGTFWADYKQAESGTSIYANKIKSKKLEEKSIDSINQLQLWATNYLLDNKDTIVRMTIEVGDVRDVYSTVDVGDWVTVVDTDTGLNSDFKIVGMEINVSQADGETLYLELSSRKSVVLEQFMKMKKSSDSQSTYGQGATNVFQIGPMSENAVGGTTGYDYPLQIKFYVSADALAINKVKLNWKQSDFQGFTSGANATIFTQSGGMQNVYLKVDGTDRTMALGGPWANSVVSNLDISSYIATTGYHTIELSPAGSIPRRLTADGWAQVYIQSK